MIPVYYRGVIVFDFMKVPDVKRLIKKKIIFYSVRQKRYILKPEEVRFPHLLADGLEWSKTKEKRLNAFRILNEKNLTCEDCGKKDSFHIRPVIKDGQANFREFVCTCETCRKKILKSNDIYVPHFRRSYSVQTILDRWKVSLSKHYIPTEVERILSNPSLIKERIILDRQYGMTKLAIPSARSNSIASDWFERNKHKIIDSLGLKHDREEIELNKENKDLLREFFKTETQGSCPCCDEVYTPENPPTLDHILSKQDGGEDTLINLFGLCEDCNKKKSSDSVLEHLLRVEYKSLPFRVRHLAISQQREIVASFEKRQKQFNSRTRSFIYATRKR